MKIGVTGATGHIGYAICLELIRQGYEVKALVRQRSPWFDDFAISCVEGDILQTDSLATFMEGCEVVIHAAARIELAYSPDVLLYETNVTGVQRVIDAAKQAGVRKLIHFSSIHAFNQFPQDKMLDENREGVGKNAIFYDQTKREGLKLALTAVSKDFEVVVLCPTSVVGKPDFKPSKIGKAIIDIYQGSVPAVINGGFNFVDVQQVAKAAVAAIEHGKSGQVYIIGGEYHTLKQFADFVLEAKGSTKRLIVLPLFLAYLAAPFVKFYAKLTGRRPMFDTPYLDVLRDGNIHISSGKAIDDLGLQTVPLKEIIYTYINWLQETKRVRR